MMIDNSLWNILYKLFEKKITAKYILIVLLCSVYIFIIMIVNTQFTT